MIAGPATLTVLIIVVLLLAAGVVLLKVVGRGRRRAPRFCQHCQHENSRKATYCARCGQELETRDS